VLHADCGSGRSQCHFSLACGAISPIVAFWAYSDRLDLPVECPHAIHGAVRGFERLKTTHIASAIAGHHIDMPNVGRLRERVVKSRTEDIELLDRARALRLSTGAGAANHVVGAARAHGRESARFCPPAARRRAQNPRGR
jgi:hypothetical protein